MDFPKLSLDPLSEGFVAAKPIKYGEYDEEEIYELGRNKHLIIEVKRNGWKLLPVKVSGRIKIYTDGQRDITDRIPHIANEIQKRIPDDTFLLGEGLVVVNGADDRGKVNSVLNLKTSAEKALSAQKMLKMQLMVFDIIFWNGRCLFGEPYIERLRRIQKLFENSGYVHPPEVLNVTFDEAKELAVKNNWEGVVLYDEEFKSSFRVDGKDPERPEGCYKWKPMYEDDFFVKDWISTEKDPKLLKEIVLLQIDPKTGKEIVCGKHGTFSAKKRAEIQALLRKKEPVVVQFEYEQRTKDNKLENKRFVDIRYDKKWHDCLMPSKIFPKNLKHKHKKS